MPTAPANRVAIPLTLSAPAPVRNGRLRQLAGVTMGTTWSVKFIGSDATAQTLDRAIRAALARVIAQMSPWEHQSDLSRFNALADRDAMRLPDEFADVIGTGLRIAQETAGAYDPAMGALVDLWGFGPRGPVTAPPPPDQVADAGQHSGWRHLRYDTDRRELTRTKPVQLDLNGIAKGYAVDLIMATLHGLGVHHALVEIGGELTGSGMKADGTPWWVSLARPAEGLCPDIAPPLLIALHGLAIATSGSERGFVSAGTHYAHTIDPRTGSPVRNDMVSASVLHASCMEADAYATALVVMGADAATAFAARANLAAVMLVKSPDGTISERITPALKAMLS